MYSIEFSKAANKTLAAMPRDLRALLLSKMLRWPLILMVRSTKRGGWQDGPSTGCACKTGA